MFQKIKKKRTSDSRMFFRHHRNSQKLCQNAIKQAYCLLLGKLHCTLQQYFINVHETANGLISADMMFISLFKIQYC